MKESSEREAHSIELSQHRNYLETVELEDQPEFSTSKSVSVSRVRVEVSLQEAGKNCFGEPLIVWFCGLNSVNKTYGN